MKPLATASSIWNSVGIDSPQFFEKAARAAMIEYQKSADLLEPGQFTSFSSGVLNRILANREQALAHVAYMEAFLYDEQSDEGGVLDTDLAQPSEGGLAAPIAPSALSNLPSFANAQLLLVACG